MGWWRPGTDARCRSIPPPTPPRARCATRIYHSHTRSAPYPSQTDINLAFHPDAIYLIVGLAGDAPELRAYRIVDGRVDDAELVIEE